MSVLYETVLLDHEENDARVSGWINRNPDRWIHTRLVVTFGPGPALAKTGGKIPIHQERAREILRLTGKYRRNSQQHHQSICQSSSTLRMGNFPSSCEREPSSQAKGSPRSFAHSQDNICHQLGGGPSVIRELAVKKVGTTFSCIQHICGTLSPRRSNHPQFTCTGYPQLVRRPFFHAIRLVFVFHGTNSGGNRCHDDNRGPSRIQFSSRIAKGSVAAEALYDGLQRRSPGPLGGFS
jgi:hypothetical protein